MGLGTVKFNFWVVGLASATLIFRTSLHIVDQTCTSGPVTGRQGSKGIEAGFHAAVVFGDCIGFTDGHLSQAVH
jgi:hypothetical protein